MTSGADGRENRVRINWEQFQRWQRWDEYPERKDNPPMTVDMTFWLSGKKYYLDYVNQRYAIFTEEWETVAEDVNFLLLLNKPIREWDNKSFHELVKEMLFND